VKDLLEMGYTRVDVPLAVGSYEVNDEAAKAIAFNDNTIELDPDLQYIRFIMCHEGVNANGDYFTKEVLKRAQFTPRLKPVNWEHGQPMIGTMIDSRYAEDANGRGYIEAIGVVWKFIYPELADAIKQKSASGELKLSMECYYKDANYKVGDQIYDQETAEKMGIVPYVGREYLGKKVERIFTDVLFGGVGIVANPADKEAVFLAVAKDLDNQESTSASDFIRPVTDFRQRTLDRETTHAVVVAKYIKALDTAKSQIVARFNDESLKTKDQHISEVRSIIEGMLSEINKISTAYHKGVAGEESHEMEEDDNMARKKIATEIEQVETEVLETETTETVEEVVESSEEVTTEEVTTEVETIKAEEVVETEESVEEIETEEVSEANEAQAALEARVAELESELENEMREHDALKGAYAALKREFDQAKAQQVIASRISELSEVGIKFVGQRLAKEEAKIANMDDSTFADYKELLMEVAGVTVTASSEVVEEVETVNASEDEEIEEEVTVEGVESATAGLNIEVDVTPNVRKPFAHLRRSN